MQSIVSFFFMSSPWLISTRHELSFSSSHSDRMKHRILLRYKAVLSRFRHALQLVSTVMNESQSYDQFMSSIDLLVCSAFVKRLHSCTSVAGSEQAYLRECTLQLGKMYSVARHHRQKQI